MSSCSTSRHDRVPCLRLDHFLIGHRFSCSNDSCQPSSATPSASTEKEAAKQQQGSNKDQQQPQPKKTLPVQKAGVKKAQAERLGPGRGRGEKVRGRGPGRGRLGERLADRSGRGHENGREQFPPSRLPSRPHSRHGTPPLSGGRALLPASSPPAAKPCYHIAPLKRSTLMAGPFLH